MKLIIFQLFICFPVIFNSFAGMTLIDEAPVATQKPLRAVYLDEEPVIAGQGFTWLEGPDAVIKTNLSYLSKKRGEPQNSAKQVGRLIPINYDPFFETNIPPPITNGCDVVFPKLFSSDNRLIGTNATYSRINGRILTFTQFSSTGCKSLNLDILKVHFRILEYLKLADMQQNIIAAEAAKMEEQKRIAKADLEEQKRIAEYNRIEEVVITKEGEGIPLSGENEHIVMRNLIKKREAWKAYQDRQRQEEMLDAIRDAEMASRDAEAAALDAADASRDAEDAARALRDEKAKQREADWKAYYEMLERYPQYR
ncbi:MAG: hypothetical protein KKE37_07970 [Verrucomicrobia bacterium]|nr:hypothetical protein [Verrucomicrobiota bacterium]MBU4291215.1 hypothetical protein [Verrucomicrobiota bacterium]MBU4429273.1 hypothetical protein [Verrucomicrobiota bacterium]MCG2678616.1 hypothetical protein [Kiritimatiellia bacterium]